MWADETPELPGLRAQAAGGAQRPLREDGGKAAAPPRRAPGLGKAQPRQPPPRNDGPDFGPNVDWRLSRVNLDEHEAPGRKATPRSPSKSRTEPSAVPPRLAGRLAMPGAPSAAETKPRSVQYTGGDLRVVLTQCRDAASSSSSRVVTAHEGRGAISKTAIVQAHAAPAPASKPAKPSTVAAAEQGVSKPRVQPQWRYKDPKGAVRECLESELLSWSKAGYFAAGLPVQRMRAAGGDDVWITLGEALKQMAPKAEAAAPKPAPEAPRAEAIDASETEQPDTGDHPSQSGWDRSSDKAAAALFGAGHSSALWLYKDLEGVVQGPFSGSDMLSWFSEGYLHDRDLPVADAEAREFKPLNAWLSSTERNDH